MLPAERKMDQEKGELFFQGDMIQNQRKVK